MRFPSIWAIGLGVLFGACHPASSDDGGFKGTFSISGAPHSGPYDNCEVAPFAGGVTALSCTGLAGCPNCQVTVALQAKTGDFKCEEGKATITVIDDGFPANPAGQHGEAASCQAPDQMTVGMPSSMCPGGTCNQAVGQCAVTVTTLSAPAAGNGGADGFGHFSGSITATIFETFDDLLGCKTGSGSTSSVSVSGSW